MSATVEFMAHNPRLAAVAALMIAICVMCMLANIIEHFNKD